MRVSPVVVTVSVLLFVVACSVRQRDERGQPISRTRMNAAQRGRERRPGPAERFWGAMKHYGPLKPDLPDALTPEKEADRVRRVEHTREGHEEGRYRTIAKVESDYDRPAAMNRPASLAAPTRYPPQPDVMIYSGWLYVTGDAPFVGTRAVTAQAEGCRLLLYYHQIDGTNPRYFVRVCYLEGNASQVVWLLPNVPDEPRQFFFLTPGTYVDAETNPAGDFQEWRDTHWGHRDPYVLPIEGLPSTDVHWDIMRQVDEARSGLSVD